MFSVMLKLNSDSVTWDAYNVIECFKIFRLIFNEMMMKHCSLYSVIKKFNKSESDILLISNCWLAVLTAHWRKNESVYSITAF